MDLAYIAGIIGGFIGIILLFTTYMYIDKLEKMGCACAEHPYRKFIKGYCIFAIVFLAVTMFLPAAAVAKALGPIGVSVLVISKVLYVITTIIFFVLALIYVRYLMKEKCKCSEDIRRDILYVWAILEIVILTALVLIPLVVGILTSSYQFVASQTKGVASYHDAVRSAAVNPLGSARKVPKALKNSLKKMAKRVSK